jgi:hypothetical protein
MRLKDWFKTGAVHAFSAIFGSIAYGVMMHLMGLEGSFADMLRIAVVYLLVFGGFMSVVLIMSVQKQNLPLALSFGSTWKEAFWGMQCYRVVYIALVTVAAVVLSLLTGEDGADMAAAYILTGVTVMLIMGTLGSVTGIAGLKFGKGAMIAIGIATGVLMVGLLIGFVILVLSTGKMEIDLSGWLLWLLPVFGLVLHIGSMVLEHRMIFQYNVKL